MHSVGDHYAGEIKDGKLHGWGVTILADGGVNGGGRGAGGEGGRRMWGFGRRGREKQPKRVVQEENGFALVR